MAKQANTSIKRIQIDKTNRFMVGSIAIASFITVFCLMASRALISQQSYQSRVIKQKGIAVKQLQSNITATKSLVTAYSNFVSQSDNVLGGNPSGTGSNDGDNAKIILDALPSKYDFPALATSLQGLLSGQGAKINGITGTDDELKQLNSSSPNPQPVEIPFQVTVAGPPSTIQNVIAAMQRSIRPIQIQTITFTADQTNLQATISAKTFYQPEKSLTITTKEIK
ncbi:MAG TPA: hypothetical protein VLE69_01945 [Candidatus Saccharimonadales bacterium]|nr:hypothetical protein [Candidatus Saccharimonadales bacterium]